LKEKRGGWFHRSNGGKKKGFQQGFLLLRGTASAKYGAAREKEGRSTMPCAKKQQKRGKKGKKGNVFATNPYHRGGEGAKPPMTMRREGEKEQRNTPSLNPKGGGGRKVCLH